MDFHVGIRGKDFSMLCCDTRAVQQIITIKNDEEKLVPVDTHKLFAISGEAGDRVHFAEYVIANTKLYALRHGQQLSTHAVAHFTRQQLAQALRKAPYHTNLLLAGYDEGAGASLYWLDYLATMHKMNICGTGYGSYFALSLFDKMWHPDLTQDDAFEMMKQGVAEVRRRLVVAPEKFQVKVVTSAGIQDLGFI
eukprot:TRINITY_DN16793_c0_g1_i6.p1 TRINITY_DN16793_c0_g1~~TRINITY_DN16793_c0_g1_i6.p1  ORF type:complete len:194 (-),score=28.17 TRINITY_DN16793_c0_g1_i6:208-789(-)